MKKGEAPEWEKEDAMPIMKHSKEMFMGAEMDPELGGGMQEPCNMLLAHSYVPWQSYEQAFSPREALMKGTLFPELWGVYPIPE